MKIKVYRNSGDNESPDMLVDELCTTEAVGKQKGLKFLYDNIDRMIYELDIRYAGIINPNDVVYIDDTSIGESFYARVKSISISGSTNPSLDISQNLVVERYIE